MSRVDRVGGLWHVGLCSQVTWRILARGGAIWDLNEAGKAQRLTTINFNRAFNNPQVLSRRLFPSGELHKLYWKPRNIYRSRRRSYHL